MRKFLQKVRDVMTRYDPNPVRRAEVIRLLEQRPSLSHEAWQCRFSPDIPVDFVRWFRDMCSKNFEFDLSGALPEDRMREDLGMNDATWGDVSWDIEEDFEEHFGVKLPDEVDPPITKFGQLLEFLWKYAQKQTHDA